ncbi:MAG: hypothetical protein HC808_02945 [Candidatus Competibacteraceae bacterium]|nr:hypothetical protein [Candidatus Competibacteraceae bacterium]
MSCSVIYFLFAWTPSSYALALRMLGVVDDGLVLGSPRPIRSDEWVVFTPYIQAVVNNGFERYNETSIYHEDFRNFNSLPLWDWALLFKPQYWMFFISNPAHAFSFSHVFLIGLFLIGYYYLLQSFGFSSLWSAGGSLLLFFTGYVQTWLTTTGPLLAYFPWVVLVFISNYRPTIKIALLTYVLTVFLLSHLYASFIASLFFAGAVTLIAFCPKEISFKNIFVSLVAGSFSLLLVWLYYIDVIPLMTNTIYPGQRVISGGTVSFSMWMANFFPFFVSSNFEELIGSSIANIATSGSYLLLLTIIFIDYRSLVRGTENSISWNNNIARQCIVLMIGLALLSIWMLFPIPASYGKWLYWHKAIAQRHVFTFGLLLLTLTFVILRTIPLKINFNRLMLAICGVLAIWVLSKRVVFNVSLLEGFYDVLIILPLVIMFIIQRLLLLKDIQIASATCVILCAAVGNFLGFAHFNPIQSAKPIFEKHETKITEGLKRLAAAHPKGWLVAEGFPGALLNGWGYQSVAHVLIAPKTSFFKPFFPDLEESQFNHIFNRYAHIHVGALLHPTLFRINVIRVPLQSFFPNIYAPKIQADLNKADNYANFGNIDDIKISENKIEVVGWGHFDAKSSEDKLQLITDIPVRSSSIIVRPRIDLAIIHGNEFLLSGFKLTIDSDIESCRDATEIDLCLVFFSKNSSGFQLTNRFNPSACDKLTKK